MNKIIRFDDFPVGQIMGQTEITYSEEFAECWQRIFGSTSADGANNAAEGASIAVVMMMRGYLSIVTPRPPGNVQARQQLTLLTPPRRGETIHMCVACAHKEIRRERRHVELAVDATGDGGRAIFTGRIFLIWAA